MCFRVTCEKCQKETWSGCGMHVASTMEGLRDDEICKCPGSQGLFAWFKSLLGF